jgi:predicted molibdopterin-dependent oxidoreductase YjgC
MESVLGLYAQSNSLADVAGEAKSILVIGSNTTEQHPIFGVKLRQAVLQRGCKLVVAHSDFINMAEYAALRLVYKPGSAATLVNGIMHCILKAGWENRAFIEKYTSRFDEFKQSLEKFTPDYIAKITGVEEKYLEQAAEILALERPMAIVWGADLVHYPTGRANIMSLVNLQLLLGNFGMPGGGLIPLRCQNNSQGAWDMGGHPAFYPGYQAAEETATRKKFEAAWGKGVPTKPGMNAMEMITAATEGKLRAMYIMGEDLVGNALDGPWVRRSLQNCDFVVQAGVFESETSRHADILLPGVTFAEKTGTFTNTERRIQMVHQAIEPQGESRPDWQIIVQLANHIQSNGSSGEYAKWDYSDTPQIMAEISQLTPIYAGISHERLERTKCLQWPVKNFSHPGTPILSAEAFKGAQGRFSPVEYDRG